MSPGPHSSVAEERFGSGVHFVCHQDTLFLCTSATLGLRQATRTQRGGASAKATEPQQHPAKGLLIFSTHEMHPIVSQLLVERRKNFRLASYNSLVKSQGLNKTVI